MTITLLLIQIDLPEFFYTITRDLHSTMWIKPLPRPHITSLTTHLKPTHLPLPFQTLTSRTTLTSRLSITSNPIHHYSSTPHPKMRIPYASNTPPEDATDETKAIYTRISERRKPRPLIPLDLALLHNPSIADGWNTLLGAIRNKTSLDPGLMEMAVSRIAILNRAVWEWSAHAPLALKGGLKREVLDVVRRAEVVPKGLRAKTEEEEQVLSEVEWAVLAFTDQMTKEVEVDEGVFEKVKELLGQTGVMEMTATVATYNCVSRLLVALNVGEKNGLEMEMPVEG